MRVPSVDADDGKINPAQFMPQPTRQNRPGFKADALSMGCMFAKQVGQSAWIRFNFSLEDYLPISPTTHTAVCLCEASSPTYCFIIALPIV